jgi:hypothetical protein
MNTSIIQVVLWVLAGMVIMGLIVWFTMPLLMLVKHKSKLISDVMGLAGKDLSEVVESV